MLMEAEKRKYPGGEDGIVEKKQAVAILDRTQSRSELGSFDANDMNSQEVTADSLLRGPVTEIIECPQNRVSAIIGSKGWVIQEMKRRSCCKITVNQDMPVGRPRNIVVVGLIAGVELVKEMSLQIIENGPAVMMNPTLSTTAVDEITVTITECSEKVLNLVRGQDDEIKHELVRRTGVDLAFSGPGTDDDVTVTESAPSAAAASASVGTDAKVSDRSSGWIKLSGKKIPVLEIKALIANLIVSGALPPPKELSLVPVSSARQALAVPAGSRPLPGPGSGLGSSFTPLSGEDVVVASHYHQAMLAAQQMGNPGDITTSEMDIAQDKVATVIGAKGVVISQIMRLSACRITILQEHLPDGCPRKVHFTGTVQQIGSAMVLVANVIAQGPDCVMKGANSALAKNATQPLHGVEPSLQLPPQGPQGHEQHRHMYPHPQQQQQQQQQQYPYQHLAPPQPSQHLMYPMHSTVIQEVTMLQSQLHTLTTHASGDLIQRMQRMCDLAISISEDVNNSDQKIVRIVGEREQVQHVLQALFQMFQHGADPAAVLATIPVIKTSYSYAGPTYLPVANISPYSFPPPAGAPPPLPASFSTLMHGASPNPGGYGLSNYSGKNSASSGRVLTLGADGQSGSLYERSKLPDGFFQQVAMVKRAVCGRIVGKLGANLAMFRNKSGAWVSVEKTTDVVKLSNPNDLTRVVIIGDDAAVTLGAQLLQEIVSHGTRSMMELPDVPFSLPPGYKLSSSNSAGPSPERPPQPSSPAIQQQMQFQHQLPIMHAHASQSGRYRSSSPQHATLPLPIPLDTYPNIARINLNSNTNSGPGPLGQSSPAMVDVAPSLRNPVKRKVGG